MNLAETLRGLLRRWYITFPGLVVACAVALGAWYVVPPNYERSATQLLVPGKQNIPANSNPLLYLGGLSSAADVLARAVGAKNVLDEVQKTHPNTEVVVERDGSSTAPFIVITVTARSDAEAGEVLSQLVDRTGTVLASLQKSQHIPAAGRITVQTITVDTTGTLQQRNRLVATGAAGVVVAALALLLAALTDGLARQRRRRARSSEDDDAADPENLDDVETAEDDDLVDAESIDLHAELSDPVIDTHPRAAVFAVEVQTVELPDDEEDGGTSADTPKTTGPSRSRRR